MAYYSPIEHLLGDREMDSKTISFVMGLLADRDGDVELTARFMRDSLRIGGLKKCREMIESAAAVIGPEELKSPHEVNDLWDHGAR